MVLICVLIPFAGSSIAAAQSQCEHIFRVSEAQPQTSTPVEHILDFAATVSYRSLTHSNVEALFEDLRGTSKLFADFISRQVSAGALSKAQKSELIVRYHDEFFAEFRDPEKLRDFQNRSLLSSLRRHGYKPESGNAREELRKLSRANFDRIAAERGLREPRSVDQDVEDLLQQLDLTLFRNSHREDVTSGLILSSRRLEAYGLGGGLNSRQEFNRDFLQSDDQIFFFVKMRPSDFSGSKSNYGKYRQKLKVNDAAGEVWISPFVMYEADLVDFARRSLPQLKSLLVEKAIERESKSRHGRSVTRIVRSNLHLFDFTYDDYQTLIRRQLRISLTRLKRNPLARFKYGFSYAQAKARLLKPSTRKEEDLVMDALVQRPLGLPKMEAKIPVALSASAIVGFGE